MPTRRQIKAVRLIFDHGWVRAGNIKTFDVFVPPSLRHEMPNYLLEVRLAKTSHRHFCWMNIGCGENGILIPVNDGAALARATFELLRI